MARSGSSATAQRCFRSATRPALVSVTQASSPTSSLPWCQDSDGPRKRQQHAPKQGVQQPGPAKHVKLRGRARRRARQALGCRARRLRMECNGRVACQASRQRLSGTINVARAAASSSHGSRREQPSCSCAPARPRWPPPACPAPVGSGSWAAAARWLCLAAAGPRLLPASAAAPPPARLATAKAAAAGPQAAAAARSRTARALRPLAPAGAACGFGYPLLLMVRTCTAAGRPAARPGRKGEGRASCAAGGISDGGP